MDTSFWSFEVLKLHCFVNEQAGNSLHKQLIQSNANDSSLLTTTVTELSLGSNQSIMERQISSTLLPDEVFDCPQIHVGVKYLQQAHVNSSQPQSMAKWLTAPQRP